MPLKIESVESGETFNLREDNLEVLKSQLSLLCPIPPEEQILLFGPPYRVFDAKKKVEENQRIFLFDRRVLANEHILPPRRNLIPIEAPKLDLVQGSSSGNHFSLRSQKLFEHVEYFEQQIRRYQIIETYFKEVFNSCEKCMTRLKVQLDGIKAAIDNLKDTFVGASKQYIAVEQKATERQEYHKSLIQNFPSNLDNLSAIPLHQSVASRFNDESSTGIRSKSTLGDCVSIERENLYLNQCIETFRKVDDTLTRIKIMYSEIKSGVNELREPEIDIPRLMEFLNTIREESKIHYKFMEELRLHFQFAYDAALAIENNTMYDEDIEKTNLDLRNRRNNFESNSPWFSIERRIKDVDNIKRGFEDAQDKLLQEIYGTLRKIAGLQTSIQYKLKKDVDWIKKWNSSRAEYFEHLEKISKLPQSYHRLICEVVRRREADNLMDQIITNTIDKLRRIHEEEKKIRNNFLQAYGNDLPSTLLEKFPALYDEPPSVEVLLSATPRTLPEVDKSALAVDDVQEIVRLNDIFIREITQEQSILVSKIAEENYELKQQVKQLQDELALQGKGNKLKDDANIQTEQTKTTSTFSQTATPTNDIAVETDGLDLRELEENAKALIQGFLRLQSELAHPLVHNLLQEASNYEEDISPRLINNNPQSNKFITIDGTVCDVEEITRSVENLLSRVKHRLKYPTIAFMDFKRGDTVLFFPTQGRAVWFAFAAKGKAPNRFLSQNSLESFLRTSREPTKRMYILGTIIYIEEKEADVESSKMYKIPEGTIYYIFEVEVLSQHLITDAQHDQKGSRLSQSTLL